MNLRDVLRISGGIALVAIGIVGLILPIMPGWIFVIPGLLILADYYPPIHRLVEWIKSRFRDAQAEFQKRDPPSDAPVTAEPQDAGPTHSSPNADPSRLATGETKRPQ